MNIDPGVGYALIAACFGGAYIFGIKRFLSGVHPAAIAVVASTVGVLAYTPFVVLTVGVAGAVETGLDARELLFIAAAIGMSCGGYLLFLTALRAGDVSYVAPLSKVNPVFVLPIEILVFNELLTTAQTVGVLLVTVGIYVANYQRGRLYEPLVRVASHRPARLALGSAAVYAVFDVMQRFVLQELGVAPPLWVLATRGGIAVLLVPIALRATTTREISTHWRGFVIVGLLNVGLAHFGSVAFDQLSASIASPLVNAQSIVAVALGGLLLREGAIRYRALGAVLAVAGISFIAAG